MVAPWSAARRRQAVELYRSGRTLVEVCHLMSAGSGTVQRYLRESGVEMRPASKRPHPETLRREVADYYRDCRSILQCCKKFHLSTEAVSRFVREAGVPIDYFWTREREQKAVDLYESGLNLSEVSRFLGTNKGRVRLHLQQRGVRIRTQLEVAKRGNTHPGWVGEKRLSEDGYVFVYCPLDHPRRARGYSRIPEHRLVMEQHLGRYLDDHEVVHHKNKNRQDNQIENLQLFATNGEHLAFELKAQCPKWSEEGAARMRAAHRQWCESRRKKTHPTPDDRSSL